jgi:superoxide dismutase, Fe-Mn family
MPFNRRNFLLLAGAATGAAALGITQSGGSLSWSLMEPAIAANLLAQTPPPPASGPHRLPDLPYAYGALAPHIDEETMRFHHDRHHAAYVNNLNTAIAQHPNLSNLSPEDLMRQLSSVPEEIRPIVRNNGGGHLNHTMFWEIMSPDGGGEPTGAIAIAIDEAFGSFDAFKQEFNRAGEKQFGSGWAWLVRTGDGELKVTSTPNQDSPLMEGMYPIMGNDVWEHAYYLSYRNRRAEYLNAWWNVVNWDQINQRLERSIPRMLRG